MNFQVGEEYVTLGREKDLDYYEHVLLNNIEDFGIEA